VVENLPPEPQKGIKILRQPKNVVENKPLLPSGVVENRPLAGFFLRKSKKVVEIEPAFRKKWLRIDHLIAAAASIHVVPQSCEESIP
jgi:hypothetical protein